MRFTPGQRIIVHDELGIVIPLYSTGEVVEVNFTRSKWGYHILCRWDAGLPKETWVARRNIQHEEVQLANTG